MDGNGVIRTSLDFEQRRKVERARKALKAKRKDNADKWVVLYDETNPMTGVRQILWYNVDTEEVVGRRDDLLMEQTLEANKDEYVATMNRTGKVPDMRRVARIPMGHFMDHFQTAMVERDFEYVKKKLNDPDNAAFRTHRGKL